MRDPERILRVTKALEECWRECPDMRFLQMMDNILTYNGRKTRTEAWNMEEGELLNAIEKFKQHCKDNYIQSKRSED